MLRKCNSATSGGYTGRNNKKREKFQTLVNLHQATFTISYFKVHAFIFKRNKYLSDLRQRIELGCRHKKISVELFPVGWWKKEETYPTWKVIE